MPSGSGTSVRWFKRAQRGLFGGKQRLTGNHVSPSKRHVRRVWLPNVQFKRLWSDTLQRHIGINVTTAVLRQVDTMGGVDNYLLQSRPEKLNSVTGLRLRRMLEDRRADAARRAAPGTAEAAALREADTSGSAPAAAELR